MQKEHNKKVNEKLRLGRTPAELLFSLFSVPLFPSLREGIGVGILFLLYLLTSNADLWSRCFRSKVGESKLSPYFTCWPATL